MTSPYCVSTTVLAMLQHSVVECGGNMQYCSKPTNVYNKANKWSMDVQMDGRTDVLTCVVSGQLGPPHLQLCWSARTHAPGTL